MPNGYKIKKIYVGTQKVRPKDICIDFLLVGGGGGGAHSGGGGGGGGFIECCGYKLKKGSHSITIGAGANGYTSATNVFSGCPSCFGDIVAYGGGAGGYCTSSGKDGGSGGGSGRKGSGGSGCSGQGNNGGTGSSGLYAGGGGGGAGSAGCAPSSTGVGGRGGDGKCSCISGACVWYAGGGGGGNNYGSSCCANNAGCGSGACGGYYTGTQTNAKCYGGGGGAGGTTTGCNYHKGCQGIFILRYPTACGYNISGGTCYTCGDYTIHCFTSDGTLTVN